MGSHNKASTARMGPPGGCFGPDKELAGALEGSEAMIEMHRGRRRAIQVSSPPGGVQSQRAAPVCPGEPERKVSELPQDKQVHFCPLKRLPDHFHNLRMKSTAAGLA